MKLKIIMTITGLSIASMGYGSKSGEAFTAKTQARKVPTPSAFVERNGESKPLWAHESDAEASIPKDQEAQSETMKLSDLQSKQRAQLSSPFRAVSNFSKNRLGIQEQGILISKKPSLYDVELAKIREDGQIGTNENDQALYLSKRASGQRGLQNIGMFDKSTIGTEEYHDANNTRIAVNPITGTIKWIDNDGNIIKMLKKNLNGTTTETAYSVTQKAYSDGSSEKIITETTYATENPNRKRTVTESSFLINSQTTLPASNRTTNYDNEGEKTSSRLNDSGTITIYSLPIGQELSTQQAVNKFYSETVNGATGDLASGPQNASSQMWFYTIGTSKWFSKSNSQRGADDIYDTLETFKEKNPTSQTYNLIISSSLF